MKGCVICLRSFSNKPDAECFDFWNSLNYTWTKHHITSLYPQTYIVFRVIHPARLDMTNVSTMQATRTRRPLGKLSVFHNTWLAPQNAILCDLIQVLWKHESTPCGIIRVGNYMMMSSRPSNYNIRLYRHSWHSIFKFITSGKSHLHRSKCIVKHTLVVYDTLTDIRCDSNRIMATPCQAYLEQDISISHIIIRKE